MGQTGQGKIFFFSMKKETNIISWEQEFLYNTE